MPADPQPELALLLEEERRLILDGAWAGLDPLAARKEACLARLDPADGGRLAPLSAALARNRALLAAAIEGLREGADRHAALKAARAGLVTYDARGLRAELPLAPPQVERRA